MLLLCCIHKQNLASIKRHLGLMKSCQILLKLLIILKQLCFNTKVLKEFCDEMGSHYQNFLFHSEVGWLPRGEVLKGVYELRKEAELFVIDEKFDISLYFQEK